MSSEEIRQSFFDFFKKRGHVVVPSSSLIPDDLSVLFTTAGMQQFKKYYTGELDPVKDFGSRRVISIQKCFRTSDIDEVGDKTHLTFFEMMGNFSFGPVGGDNPEDFRKDGYYKRSAIFWSYEYLISILGIDAERIYVTVFGGDKEAPFDEESYRIWKDEIGLMEQKIRKGSREDNFWGPTGEEGPCGPTTEIYIDDVEVWNLVFNEYFKNKNGRYEKLKNSGVDTGMSIERLLCTINGVDNIFDTDFFDGLISKVNEFSLGADERIKRILADHLRASIFLIADGVRPSNKEAGYVLRRLLRRIMAYQIKYDIHADLFFEAVGITKNKFGEFYPEVNKTKEIIAVLEEEREKFEEAISRGIKEIEKLKTIDGIRAFQLYETFGLPFELIKELAPKEAVKNLNKSDFDAEFEKHQEVSRAGAEKKFGGHGLIMDTGELKAGSEEEIQKVIQLHTLTHLLHWALREVLGKEVHQMGSDISPERARFDFSFNRKMTPEEIQKTENLIKEKINEKLPVSFKEMPKEQAEKIGALAFFKQKYPEKVKVYFIGEENNSVSKEFCAGPHVKNTAEISRFKIAKEEAVGSGARRIRIVLI